jgi:hypothetical protein
MRMLTAVFLGGCNLGLEYVAKDTGLDVGDFGDTDESSEPSADGSPPMDTAPFEEAEEPGVVTDMLPSFGSMAGGTTVRFLGGPFADGTQVLFGGVPATMASNNGTIIQVEAPPATAEGYVDILIQLPGEEALLEDAFHYFADGSGLAGAIGSVRYTTLMGDYWIGEDGNPAVLDEASALLTFIQPTDFHWWEFFTGEMDSCSLDGSYSYSDPISVFDSGESSITLQRNEVQIPMFWNSTENFFASEPLSSSEIYANAVYDLAPFSEDLFGFAVSQIASSSDSAVVSSPALQGVNPPQISQSQTFVWSPSGASWIRLTLSLMNESGTGYEQSISCVFQDSGSFTVDGSLFTLWPIGRQMDVFFGRVIEQVALLPHNNSESRVAGEYLMIGAAFTQ